MISNKNRRAIVHWKLTCMYVLF